MTACAICGGALSQPWADLGTQPLANALRPMPHITERPDPLPRYDLAAVRCLSCGHAQLRTLVGASERYQDYAFRSGLSATFRAHCDDVARTARRFVPSRNWVLDLGANDGTLLSAFHLLGLQPRTLLGIDVCPVPADNAMRVLPGAFPEIVIPPDYPDHFDIVTSLNTLNAVADLHRFVAGVEKVLARGGIWLVEVPYLVDLVAGLQFDTIYHEHVHYFAVTPFAALCRQHGLDVIAVEHLPRIHGGSLRLIIGRAKEFPGKSGAGPWTYFEQRLGLLDGRLLEDFDNRMEEAALAFQGLRAHVRGTWAGYGAAAKSTVVCGLFGLGPEHLAYIVDETPSKAGKLSPYDVPIVAASVLRDSPPNALLCFAWNYAEELERKLRGWKLPVPLVLPVASQAERRAA